MMETEDKIEKNSNSDNSYKNILKRFSAFGGVQVFSILLALIRGKFVALFLGPNGMGLTSLYNSSTNTIQQLAGLGLNLVLVKEVATAKEQGRGMNVILTVALRLIYFTSLLGCAVCFLASPLLSLWSFGNYDYTLAFMVLSSGVALSVGGAGYLALLQGLGEVKRLAWASVVGGLAGVICGVPLYYFFGSLGIVPALVLASLSVFLFYFFSFKRAVDVDRVSFSWKEHKPRIKKLVSLGIVLMIGSIVGTLTTYLINIFIRSVGSVDDVGLFQAANSLTNQYVGVVFSAMALDYFPRLTAVGDDLKRLASVVNRQLEIVVLIVTPLILLLILTTPLVIRILLTENFIVITPLMRWLGFGVLLQAVSFPLGYLFIARENRKIYIWVEVVFTNVMWIICSVGFYFVFSLIGLGISLVVRAFLDIIVVFFVCRRYYGYRISAQTLKVLLICMMLGIIGFVASIWTDTHAFILLPCALVVSIFYSVFRLRAGLRRQQ